MDVIQFQMTFSLSFDIVQLLIIYRLHPALFFKISRVLCRPQMRVLLQVTMDVLGRHIDLRHFPFCEHGQKPLDCQAAAILLGRLALLLVPGGGCHHLNKGPPKFNL